MNLNWFDFSIIIVVLLSMIISFFRGFLRETISLITWVAGLVFAIRFAPLVSQQFIGMIASETLRYVITFVLLFMAVFVVGLLLTMAVKRGVDMSGLAFIDRLFGGAFGVVRGIFLVAIVLMFMTMTSFKDLDIVAGSELSPSFMPMVVWLDGFLPQQLQRLTQWVKLDNEHLLQHPSQDAQNAAKQSSPQKQTKTTAVRVI